MCAGSGKIAKTKDLSNELDLLFYYAVTATSAATTTTIARNSETIQIYENTSTIESAIRISRRLNDNNKACG